MKAAAELITSEGGRVVLRVKRQLSLTPTRARSLALRIYRIALDSGRAALASREPAEQLWLLDYRPPTTKTVDLRAAAEHRERARSALDERILKLHDEGLSSQVISTRVGVGLGKVRSVLQGAGREKNESHEGVYMKHDARRRKHPKRLRSR